MNTITHSQQYLPHEINTKFYAFKLYRTGVGSPLFTGDTIFPNHPCSAGIRNLTALYIVFIIDLVTPAILLLQKESIPTPTIRQWN